MNDLWTETRSILRIDVENEQNFQKICQRYIRDFILRNQGGQITINFFDGKIKEIKRMDVVK